MSLTLLLYLTDMIDSLRGIFAGIVLLSILTSLIMIFAWVITADDKESHEVVSKLIKYLFGKSWVFFISLFLTAIIPRQTTMYMMLGSSYLSNSNIPNQVSEILNLKLEDIIKEMKKDKK